MIGSLRTTNPDYVYQYTCLGKYNTDNSWCGGEKTKKDEKYVIQEVLNFARFHDLCHY